MTDRVTGYSKCYGFVNYANLEDAAKGIEGMDGKVSFCFSDNRSLYNCDFFSSKLLCFLLCSFLMVGLYLLSMRDRDRNNHGHHLKAILLHMATGVLHMAASNLKRHSSTYNTSFLSVKFLMVLHHSVGEIDIYLSIFASFENYTVYY